MSEDAGRIVVSGLTKRFGRVAAVDGLSFTVGPGHVTGFLGPNGAGKTTTLRMLVGLVAPDAGTATIGGSRYRAAASLDPRGIAWLRNLCRITRDRAGQCCSPATRSPRSSNSRSAW